jgi:hypothetical protein
MPTSLQTIISAGWRGKDVLLGGGQSYPHSCPSQPILCFSPFKEGVCLGSGLEELRGWS